MTDTDRILAALQTACPRCSDPMTCTLVRHAAGDAAGFPQDFVAVVFETEETLQGVAEGLAKELNG